MELEYRALSEAEIVRGLAECDGWAHEEGKLVKGFHFESYLDGLAFASAVGFLAERLDHHPDIAVGWRHVRISMSTHAVEGISSYDFELARRIDRLSA